MCGTDLHYSIRISGLNVLAYSVGAALGGHEEEGGFLQYTVGRPEEELSTLNHEK